MKLPTLWLLNLQLLFCLATTPDCRREPKCEITRVHKMKAANCYDRQFKSFPQCVATDVEVIDLTFNRIRKVKRTDLTKFSYLKFLYLADNLISNLEGDIFNDLSDLTTLDLSINDIKTVPSAIFHLPSLKSLYLSQNLNINIVDALEMARPISSPLTQVDISQTTDEENYSDFPDFGTLPFLVLLNITANFYYTITPTLFMGLCSLQKLINDNVTTEFDDPCDCWKINYWLSERNVKFTPFTCSVPQSRCAYSVFNEEELQIHNQCKETYDSIMLKNKLTKIGIGVGVSILVIFWIIVFIYFWRRRNRKNRELAQKRSEKNIVDALSPLNNPKRSVPNEYAM